MATLSDLTSALVEVRKAADDANLDAVLYSDLDALMERAFRTWDLAPYDDLSEQRARLAALLAVGFEILARGK